MSKSVGNIVGLADALEAVGRDALLMYFAGAHYRKPVPWRDDVLEDAARACAGSATRGAGWCRAPRRTTWHRSRDAFFDALADDFNTPQALAEAHEWVNQANRRSGVGDAHLREMLGVLGLEHLLDADEGPPAELVELAERRRQAPRRARLRHRGPPARRAARRRLGGPRRPGGARARPGLRPWRPRSSTAATPCTRRCAAGAGSSACGPPRTPPGRTGSRRPAGASRSSGPTRSPSGPGRRPIRACAQRSSPTRTPAWRSCCAARDAFLVALDEVTDPQNLGAVARTAECAGATGLVIPERRSAEVTPAVCKASAGAVEHLRIARVRNLADFLGEAKAAGAWTYGAAAEARTPYRSPDYRGKVVLVMGAEGKGLRPRVAAACDDLVALPMRGHVGSLNVSAAAAVLLYEILQQRLDTGT